MLITMVLMTVVLFALYSIFDMSLKVYSFGNNKTEAVENSRTGLERMQRELRGAFPLDRANSVPQLFFSAIDATKTNNTPANAPPEAMLTATQVTFGNDLDGDGKVSCPNTQNKCEYITYKLGATSDPDIFTLLRNNTATGSSTSSGGEPLAEKIDGAAGLKFTYLNSNGDVTSILSEIAIVRITLKVAVKGGTANATSQTLTTDVALKNRGAEL